MLRNTARVPVVFRWEIPASLARVVTVYPIAGRLGQRSIIDYLDISPVSTRVS